MALPFSLSFSLFLSQTSFPAVSEFPAHDKPKKHELLEVTLNARTGFTCVRLRQWCPPPSNVATEQAPPFHSKLPLKYICNGNATHICHDRRKLDSELLPASRPNWPGHPQSRTRKERKSSSGPRLWGRREVRYPPTLPVIKHNTRRSVDILVHSRGARASQRTKYETILVAYSVWLHFWLHIAVCSISLSTSQQDTKTSRRVALIPPNTLRCRVHLCKVRRSKHCALRLWAPVIGRTLGARLLLHL